MAVKEKHAAKKAKRHFDSCQDTLAKLTKYLPF